MVKGFSVKILPVKNQHSLTNTDQIENMPFIMSLQGAHFNFFYVKNSNNISNYIYQMN